MIAKLVKAGYLRPEHRHDADAITSAITNMKQALRSGVSDDNGPAAPWVDHRRRIPPPRTIEDSLLAQLAHWRIAGQVWFGFFRGRTRIL
jgi:hypothetical protein